MSRLSVLLLQARHADDPARLSEVECFARHSGLEVDQFTRHDLLVGPPTLGRARSFDALMIGGSGDFYVSKRNMSHLDASLSFLGEVCGEGLPLFASCFGYQCLVEALGGEIIHDPDNTEVGTYEVSLTEEGCADELFGQLPSTFWAQLGRKDRALRLPDGVPNLAFSELCGFQGLRVPGQPIWASQFHPELDDKANRARFLHYVEGYASDLGEVQREFVLERFRASPETSSLLRRFVELVFS